jgi:hypothetical protein
MCGDVRAGGVLAAPGAISSTVGPATTDTVMDGDVADGAQGGPLHAAVGGANPARSAGNH